MRVSSSSSSVHLDLTPKEILIFQHLRDVVDNFILETQLRVAGGWVRDKILAKDCYDIDIALHTGSKVHPCDQLRCLCGPILLYTTCTGRVMRECQPVLYIYMAMAYIPELHLFCDVFSLPLECEPEEFDTRVCVSSIAAVLGLIDSIECCRNFTDEEKRVSSNAALFLPLRKTTMGLDKV